MRLFIEPEALSLFSRINSYLSNKNIEAYLVGGFVRDALLRRETADIDIAITADPMNIAPDMASELGGKYVPLDETNRIARIVLNKGTAGTEKWDVDLAAIVGDIHLDLARRDFTVDAIGVPLGQAVKEPAVVKLIDPYDGSRDLKRKVVRAVSPETFKLDAVRLLRAVRLAAELGFKIDKETEDLLKESAPLITAVAGERVREELLRLLAVPGAGRFVRYLDKLGLLTAIIPELIQAKGVEQPVEHHWDVFDHSIESVSAVDFILGQSDWEYADGRVRASLPWSAKFGQHFKEEIGYGSTRGSLLKLSALLHDVAKPGTKTIEAGGRARFFGHAEDGARLAADILARLRFSNKEIKFVETVVRYHMRPRQMSNDGLPTRRAIYRYFRDIGKTGIDALFMSLADHLASRGPDLDYNEWLRHVQEVEYVISEHFREEQPVGPPKLIDGNDLINIFGMSPGPEIGKLLEAVREAQASGEVATREQALSYVRDCLIAKGCS